MAMITEPAFSTTSACSSTDQPIAIAHIMTETTYGDTIDWDRFWSEADEADRDGAAASAHHAREVLDDFVAVREIPDSFADVGCGPGLVAFDIAERYPETSVVGYDGAQSIVEENRERARGDGRENLSFERAVLPEFDPGQEFDIVFCYATLDYVREIERGLRSLYDAVAPGGYLVFNYPNRLARAHRRRVVESPAEYIADAPGFDPERYAERFGLTIEGENLLSYDRIHDVLGTWPQSVWSVVDRPDKRWAWRHFPLVYVPK